jgi:hypothetical protein
VSPTFTDRSRAAARYGPGFLAVAVLLAVGMLVTPVLLSPGQGWNASATPKVRMVPVPAPPAPPAVQDAPVAPAPPLAAVTAPLAFATGTVATDPVATHHVTAPKVKTSAKSSAKTSAKPSAKHSAKTRADKPRKRQGPARKHHLPLKKLPPRPAVPRPPVPAPPPAPAPEPQPTEVVLLKAGPADPADPVEAELACPGAPLPVGPAVPDPTLSPAPVTERPPAGAGETKTTLTTPDGLPRPALSRALPSGQEPDPVVGTLLPPGVPTCEADGRPAPRLPLWADRPPAPSAGTAFPVTAFPVTAFPVTGRVPRDPARRG